MLIEISNYMPLLASGSKLLPPTLSSMVISAGTGTANCTSEQGNHYCNTSEEEESW